MAENLAPVDDSVLIPASVKAAADRANAYYQQALETTQVSTEQTPEPPKSGNPSDSNALPAQTPEAEPPAPTPVPESAPIPGDPLRVSELEAKLNKQERDNKALLGRLAQQRGYIEMQQTQLSQLSNPRSWAQPEQTNQRPLITEEERKAYGDEALSVMERKALEAVQPMVRELDQKTQQIQRELQRVKSQDVYETLNQNLPEWRDLNQSQEWKDWLTLPDLYSGMVRQRLLEQAFAAGDAGRVLAFFRGFLAEYPEHMGQQSPASSAAPPSQTPVRKAAIKLESLAAPGRASPSPPPSATGEAPIITTRTVSDFYRDVRRGLYVGRDDVKNQREIEIHAAIRDGRVQIVK